MKGRATIMTTKEFRLRRLAVALFLSLLVPLAAVACGGSSASKAPADAAPIDFSRPGPYPVGVRTIDLGDRIAYVFYPADPARLGEGEKVSSYSSADAFPPALRAVLPAELVQNVAIDATRNAPVSTAGPFPVLLHSHGFGGYPEFASRHLIQIASWGFVAAAPDHVERDLAANSLGRVVQGEQDVTDLGAVLARLGTENSNGFLRGAVDTSKVATEGHSAGGGAAAKFAYDPAVTTFIGQAPVPPLRVAGAATGGASTATMAALYAATPPPAKPSMIIAGEVDGVVPLAGVQQEFDWLAAPKRLAVLAKAGHNAFTDICAPIRAQGGLMKFSGKLPAPDALLRLGEDGCTDANLDPAIGYGITDQLTIAQLRYVFGIDPTDVSLSRSWLDTLFPGALADYRVVD